MVARAVDIKIVRPREALPEETARRKAEFDSLMVMLRFHVKHAPSREDAEYFFRELTRETGLLSRRHGFKSG